MLYFIAVILCAPFIGALYLLFFVLHLIKAGFHLLLTVARPTLLLGVLGAFVVSGSVFGTYGVAGSMLTLGFLRADKVEKDLTDKIELTRAIELRDESGKVFGILPRALDPLRANSPFLALHLRPHEVPLAFAACVAYLEDRSLLADHTLRAFGMDFYRLTRAVLAKFVLSSEGASGVPELVDRSIRNELPNTDKNIVTRVPRKLQSWHNLPGIAQLFPNSDYLLAAAANFLPLAMGGKGSRFGEEIRGVAIASLIWNKTADQLNDAEAALLAAAINLPLRLAAKDIQLSWNKARARADHCLRNANFGKDFDRQRARDKLAAIVPVTTPFRHPSIAAAERLAGRGGMMVQELKAMLGTDWPRLVRRITVSLRNEAGTLQSEIKAAIKLVESRYRGKLWLSLSEGENAALVFGVVADQDGNIVAGFANNDFNTGTIKLPIGSIGKITAAIAIAQTVQGPASIFSRDSFARSSGPRVAQLLRNVSDAEIAAAFAALNWQVPSTRSARRHAIFGAIEVAPDDVLRASIAITDLLFRDRIKPVILPGIVREVELVSGEKVLPQPSEFSIAELRTLLNNDTKRSYVASVLNAPLARGTMRQVGNFLASQGVKQFWGKSGTADSASGGSGISPTRALWHAGGFVLQGRQYTFLVVVASRNTRRPLGFVDSLAISPITNALLAHAIKHHIGSVK
jgi:hypothetical protein